MVRYRMVRWLGFAFSLLNFHVKVDGIVRSAGLRHRYAKVGLLSVLVESNVPTPPNCPLIINLINSGEGKGMVVPINLILVLVPKIEETRVEGVRNQKHLTPQSPRHVARLDLLADRVVAAVGSLEPVDLAVYGSELVGVDVAAAVHVGPTLDVHRPVTPARA